MESGLVEAVNDVITHLLVSVGFTCFSWMTLKKNQKIGDICLDSCYKTDR